MTGTFATAYPQEGVSPELKVMLVDRGNTTARVLVRPQYPGGMHGDALFDEETPVADLFGVMVDAGKAGDIDMKSITYYTGTGSSRSDEGFSAEAVEAAVQRFIETDNW